ncbi:hypothetical protein PV326_006002 [Microctonus aethiopoides]|nr:hypothetical protein PV326_006002 [Microctonus aethiopoides]
MAAYLNFSVPLVAIWRVNGRGGALDEIIFVILFHIGLRKNKEQDVDHNLAAGVKAKYKIFQDDKYDIAILDDENLQNKKQNDDHNLVAGVKPEYQIFRDDDSDIIFDVDEEKKRLDLEAINALEQTIDPYEGLNMKHGVRGVFDIEDLIEILKKDKAQNIFVATVPSELSYVDYIVIVTAKSSRHMSALATYIRKAYKLKRYPEELLPKIEGKNSKDWMAIDLGNIALHIFSTTIREKYDLETLWSVGPTYDKIVNTPDHEIEFQESYSDYLAGFQPADENAPSSKPDVL